MERTRTVKTRDGMLIELHLALAHEHLFTQGKLLANARRIKEIT
jgi:hypothetical protein